MRLSIATLLAAMALVTPTLADNLEERSRNRFNRVQHNGKTRTIHDTTTTTETQFVTVTVGGQGEQAVCTDGSAHLTTTAVAPTQTLGEQEQEQPPAATTTAAGQDITSMETLTSTRTLTTTLVYTTPTVVTETARDVTSVHTVIVTRTKTEHVIATQTITKTHVQHVTDNVTRTEVIEGTQTQTAAGTTRTEAVESTATVETTAVETETATETAVETETATETAVETETATKTTAVETTATETAVETTATETPVETTATETAVETTAVETTATETATEAATTTTSPDAEVVDVSTTTDAPVATVTDVQTSLVLVTTTIDGTETTFISTATSEPPAATIVDNNGNNNGNNNGGNNNGNNNGNNGNDNGNDNGNNNGNNGNNNGNDNGNNGNNNGNNGGNDGNNNGDNGGNNGEDPQTSLTLDPRVIEEGLAQDGQQVPTPGQVRSLTSNNNFINFCLTQNVPLTDGKQIRSGSCNPVPQGRILAKDRLPSAKFVFPENFGSIPANQPFTIQLKLKNLQAGFFTNAQLNYYAAPAEVNDQGILIGHTHVVIEPCQSLEDTEPLDPTKFTFFKGVNGAADANGIVTANVDKGVPPGVYRLFSINTASNHMPALASVAQRGSLDDGIYFTAQ